MTAIANTLPDLSAITSVTGFRNATTDSVVASLSTGVFIDPAGSHPASSQPATIVALSDHAKAVLARAAVDRVAADRLQAQLQAARTGEAGKKGLQPDDSSQQSIFDQIHDLGRELTASGDAPKGQASTSAGADVLAGIPVWQQEGAADNIAILRAGALLYNRPREMEDLAKNGGAIATSTEGHVVSDDVLFVYDVHSAVARQISDLRDKGMTDQAQALSEALQNGTLKFQKASDVPDLNMHSTVIHFADAGGGGMWATSSLKPTGAIKTAIESGKAMALSMCDRGDFYVTW